MKLMCRFLTVSEAGYYRYKRNCGKPSRDAVLSAAIKAIREELREAGVFQSLSGVNHCFDNARMESFFATLKKELLYRIPTYRMKRSEVKTLIFRYVFIYYNQKRVYTSNQNGLPPTVYRKLAAELPMAA